MPQTSFREMAFALLLAYGSVVARGSSFGSALASPKATCPLGVHPEAPEVDLAATEGHY